MRTKRSSRLDANGVAIDQELLRLMAQRILRARRRRSGRSMPLAEWLPARTAKEYTWTARHLRYLIERLEEITNGERRKVIISAPPRFGKSVLATILYPVYRMERDPTFRVAVGSHNSDKAADFGRKARKIAEACIPSLDSRRQSATDWQTLEGGVYRSVGRGNPPMGEGFNLVVLDDPIASWADARSRATRESTWAWTQDMLGRLEPGGAAIVVMHRWHEDDPVGRLLDGETGAEWTVVNLTATAEPGDCLGRAVGETLWPERWPAEELEARMRALLPSEREALYFGRPSTPKGNVIPVEKMKPIKPGDVPEKLRRARAWDLAGTGKTGADYSVGHKAAGPDPQGNVYLGLDVTRGQWEPADRNERMRAAAERDGQDVTIRIPRDIKGDVGKEIVGNIKRVLTGYTVHAIAPTGPKDGARAEPLVTALGNGQVFLVEYDWPDFWERGQQVTSGAAAREILRDELRVFPRGRNDDMVDASCDVFSELTQKTESVHF